MSWTSFWTKWMTQISGEFEPWVRTCGPSGLEYGSDWLSLRRTVQDKMTGRDLRLTDEQVALVQRLQRGQFGDVGFNPYEVGDKLALGCEAHAAPPPPAT